MAMFAATCCRKTASPTTRCRSNEKLFQFVSYEAYAVFVWSLIALSLRIVISYLTLLSLLRSEGILLDDTGVCNDDPGAGLVCGNSDERSSVFFEGGLSSVLFGEMMTIISVFAGWVLSVLPSKVAKVSLSGFGSAPGFSFASTWVLFPISDRFGSIIPNVPTRICETTMGRLTVRELAVILPVHFLVPAFSAYAIQIFLPSSISRHAIEPIIYSEKNHWIVDFTKETFINAIFTVGILVIPELLKINGVKRGVALLILYPIYSFGVDAEGTASVFGPNVIYALRCVSKHEEVPLTQSSHMLGPIVGGLLGGKIMSIAFPDES
mmetsp:Transcript_29857/g.61918  ORF Transcript_29857/g.61918 Transcript_29857/m.61918 type:complete len:323 (+) Transcript_29857:105-1073(+)